MSDYVQIKIKELFSNIGLSYDDIVSRCSISKNTLNKLLNHSFNPTLHTLIELSYATGEDLLSFYSSRFKFEKVIIYQIIRALLMNDAKMFSILFETLKNDISLLLKKINLTSNEEISTNSYTTLLSYYNNYVNIFEFCLIFVKDKDFDSINFISKFNEKFDIDLTNIHDKQYNLFEFEYILIALVLLSNNSKFFDFELMNFLFNKSSSNEIKLCLVYLCCRQAILIKDLEMFNTYFSLSERLYNEYLYCINKSDFNNLLIIMNSLNTIPV